MEQIKYLAAFFDEKESKKLRQINIEKRLEKEISRLHITFKYRPDFVDENLLGTKIEFDVIGYGNNEKNEAVSVRACNMEKEIEELYNNPHITLSRTMNSKSVFSKNLMFYPLESPFKVFGVLGVALEDGSVCFSL